MRISAISDVHVKVPFDDADHLLSRFLTHPLVKNSDYILLLGDIFDLMCGPHSEYIGQFDHLFKLMDELVANGKKVYFFEGNHDVHLKKLFDKRWPNGDVILSQDPVIESINGKSYYFSHGDEHEVKNTSYQNYKKLILSPPLRFVANYVMPFRLLNYLGERASKMSRKKGARIYNEELVKNTFREGVQETTQGKYNFILGGHSHVVDNFKLNQDSVYLNNGYALKSKTFLMIDDHEVSFPELV